MKTRQNRICDFCKHHVMKGRGLECNLAFYESNEFGTFKRGATCIHDTELSDHFEERQPSDVNVQNMANTIERLKNERDEYKQYSHQLGERLVELAKTARS